MYEPHLVSLPRDAISWKQDSILCARDKNVFLHFPLRAQYETPNPRKHHTSYIAVYLQLADVLHMILFRKLLKRGVPYYMARFFWNLYGNHYASLMGRFFVCNGEILSKFLFGIYIDELSIWPQLVHVGCRLSRLMQIEMANTLIISLLRRQPTWTELTK